MRKIINGFLLRNKTTHRNFRLVFVSTLYGKFIEAFVFQDKHKAKEKARELYEKYSKLEIKDDFEEITITYDVRDDKIILYGLEQIKTVKDIPELRNKNVVRFNSMDKEIVMKRLLDMLRYVAAKDEKKVKFVKKEEKIKYFW